MNTDQDVHELSRFFLYIAHSGGVYQVGCFALTELGFGNNSIEMETTAIFDSTTDEFIVNSPTIKSQKYWITNGAIHAHWSIVFAQLYLKDLSNGQLIPEGVHPFLVRIRHDDMKVCDGVVIEGMNSLDFI